MEDNATWFLASILFLASHQASGVFSFFSILEQTWSLEN